MCKARQPPALVSIWPLKNIAGLRWPHHHWDMGELPGLVKWLCTLSCSMVLTARMGFWGPCTFMKANGVCVHRRPLLFGCGPTDLGLVWALVASQPHAVTRQLPPCPIKPRDALARILQDTVPGASPFQIYAEVSPTLRSWSEFQLPSYDCLLLCYYCAFLGVSPGPPRFLQVGHMT